MTASTPTRRTVLLSAAGGVGLALAACSKSDKPGTGSTGNPTGGSTTPGASGSSAAPPTSSQAPASGLPAYVPFAGAKPDYPPDSNGVEAGYLKYPSERTRVYPTPPGSGGDVTALTVTYGTYPATANNPFLQELNKRLGVNLKLQTVISKDLWAKVSTTIAGGDMPDFMQMQASQMPDGPQALGSVFADLTDYLAGDGVKNYPSLAAKSPASWTTASFNGRIYGLPNSSPRLGTVTIVRKDIAEAKGLDYKVKSADEFMALCKAFTDVKANRWAFGDPMAHVANISNWFGAPNNWAQKDGKFTYMYETEQMRRALDFMSQLYKAGVIYPDAFVADSVTQARLFFSGRLCLRPAGSIGFIGDMAEAVAADPKFYPDLIPPFDVDGGPGRQVTGPGGGTMGSINKALKKSRIEELLRIADWLSAPFGTDEYTLKTYGIEGRNFTWKDGNPVMVDSGPGASDNVIWVPHRFISNSPPVLYSPQFPQLVTDQHRLESEFLKNVNDDASVGLYSPIMAKAGAAMVQTLKSAVSDVIQGRKNLGQWDDVVKRYKGDIDTARNEFEQAYGASGQ